MFLSNGFSSGSFAETCSFISLECLGPLESFYVAFLVFLEALHLSSLVSLLSLFEGKWNRGKGKGNTPN